MKVTHYIIYFNHPLQDCLFKIISSIANDHHKIISLCHHRPAIDACRGLNNKALCMHCRPMMMETNITE